MPLDCGFHSSLFKVQDVCVQAYDALENVERALGVDPENPIIPVILILGGTLYLGYGQLNLRANLVYLLVVSTY